MKRYSAWSIPISLISILLVFITGCANSNGQDVKQFRMRENVTVGRATWKVLKAEKQTELKSNEGMGAKAEGSFVLIELEVKNGASESFMLTGIEVEIQDESSKRFAFDSKNNSTYLGMIGKDNLVNQNVGPGETVKGWVIFDIDKDARGLKLKVRDLDITSDKSAFVDLAM